jgi:lycopene cyclase domain-containing protein
MSYTALAVLGVATALAVDRWLLQTRLVRKAEFWLAYMIIAFFQLLTNGVLTGRGVVQYDSDAVIGSGNEGGPISFLGDGRLAFAPIEDLLFGFAFVLFVLSLWVWFGRRGLQPTPASGPPIWRD